MYAYIYQLLDTSRMKHKVYLTWRVADLKLVFSSPRPVLRLKA